MKEEAVLFTMQNSRLLILMAIIALFLFVGMTGEVAAHGPCHANPGNVSGFVCTDLPASEAPRSP
jgi:hypothetical protein